jgi:hypothetical protein
MGSMALTFPGGPDVAGLAEAMARPFFRPTDRVISNGSPHQAEIHGRQLFDDALRSSNPNLLRDQAAELNHLLQGMRSVPASDQCVEVLESLRDRLQLHRGTVHLRIAEGIVDDLGFRNLGECTSKSLSDRARGRGRQDQDQLAESLKILAEQLGYAREHIKSSQLFSDDYDTASRAQKLELGPAQVAPFAVGYIRALQAHLEISQLALTPTKDRENHFPSLSEKLKSQLKGNPPDWLISLQELQQVTEQLSACYSLPNCTRIPAELDLENWIANKAWQFAEKTTQGSTFAEGAIRIAFKALHYAYDEVPAGQHTRSDSTQALLLAELLTTLARAKQGQGKWAEAEREVDRGLLILRDFHEDILKEATDAAYLRIDKLEAGADRGRAVAPWWILGTQLEKRITKANQLSGGEVISALERCLDYDPLRNLYKRMRNLAELGISSMNFQRDVEEEACVQDGWGDRFAGYTLLMKHVSETLRYTKNRHAQT